MLHYVIKRIGLAIVIAVLSVTLLFIIIQLIPGDPARTILGPRATPEMIASIKERMGLDKPLPHTDFDFLRQYAPWRLGSRYFFQSLCCRSCL